MAAMPESEFEACRATSAVHRRRARRHSRRHPRFPSSTAIGAMAGLPWLRRAVGRRASQPRKPAIRTAAAAQDSARRRGTSAALPQAVRRAGTASRGFGLEHGDDVVLAQAADERLLVHQQARHGGAGIGVAAQQIVQLPACRRVVVSRVWRRAVPSRRFSREFGGMIHGLDFRS